MKPKVALTIYLCPQLLCFVHICDAEAGGVSGKLLSEAPYVTASPTGTSERQACAVRVQVELSSQFTYGLRALLFVLRVTFM